MTRTDARGSLRIWLVALAACWGCGGAGDGYQRFAVQGTVEHDGKPLKTGVITFLPGGDGAAGTANVVDGAFSIPTTEGLSPGAYRVEVYSIQPTGKKIPSSDDPSIQVDETANIVSKNFNAATTLKAEIPPGGPKEPLAFKVASPGPESKRRGSR
ncbi:hypothetical protein [Paludisphaera rhizosphaerae]|uniref:hypothetical protein n=1 Tax=Paludisphaera rhizosphaerae TaxID=2711216 RepID=UPI0013ECBDCB|nr:hypothetical protein [Paludisphaera rhizosphaerae]